MAFDGKRYGDAKTWFCLNPDEAVTAITATNIGPMPVQIMVTTSASVAPATREGVAFYAVGSGLDSSQALSGFFPAVTGPYYVWAISEESVTLDVAYAATSALPVFSVLPAISGTPAAGNTLTLSNGTASGVLTRSYRWLRNGVRIPGESANTYGVQASDRGASIEGVVLANNASGTTAARSAAVVIASQAALVPPVNTALPTITGTAQVGQTLSRGVGTWTGAVSHITQWLRGTTALVGQNGGSYTLQPGDENFTFRVAVTAVAADGSGSTAVSVATLRVDAGTGLATPVNTAVPTITGTAQEGETLTASTGTWTNSPTGYAYQWIADFTPISGATASTYLLTGAEVGAAITVQVTASNAGGAGTPAVSAATGLVTAATFPANFQSVNAVGYSTTYNSPPTFDPSGAPEYFTVVRQGFVNGVPQAISQNFLCTARMFQVWPNQNTLTADEVAVDEWLYDTDTILGVTNNTTEVVPKPVCGWGVMDRYVIGDTLFLEAVAFHGSARNGRPVDSVEFRVSDGTDTVTQLVLAPVVSSNPGDKHPVLVYRATIDVSTLANPAVLTVNFKAYPRIGDARAVFDTADQTTTWECSPRYWRRDTALYAAPRYCYVDSATGNNSNPLNVSTDPAIAAANPVTTINQAPIRAVALFGECDNLIVRGTGTDTIITNGGAQKIQNSAHMIVEPIPGTAWRVEYGASVKAVLNLGNNSNAECWTTFRVGSGTSMTVAKVGALNFDIPGGGGYPLWIIRFEAGCIWEFGAGITVSAGATVKYATNGLTISATGAFGALGNDVSTPRWRLMRGVETQHASAVENRLVLGCEFGKVPSGGALELLGSKQSGAIIAFNRFMRCTSTVAFIDELNVVGFVMAQNVIEFVGGSSTPAVRLSGDSDNPNTDHIIYWHNTVVGQYSFGRGNLLYDETDSPGTVYRTHKNHSFVGNIHTQINNKGGEFSNNSLQNGHRAYRYGVGCRGEIALFPDADPGGGFKQVYPGPNALIGSSTTVPLNADFYDKRSTYHDGTSVVAGLGDGDYRIGFASVGVARVPSSPLPFDGVGTPRNLTLACTGVYEAA